MVRNLETSRFVYLVQTTGRHGVLLQTNKPIIHACLSEGYLSRSQHTPGRLPRFRQPPDRRRVSSLDHCLDGAARGVINARIRPRQHTIQPRGSSRHAIRLLGRVPPDAVSLVQDIHAQAAVLVDQGVCVGDLADLIVDGLVRVDGHLGDAAQSHDAVAVDGRHDLVPRDVGQPVDEVPRYVLEGVRGLVLAEGHVLRGEEVGRRVRACLGLDELGEDVFLGLGPLACQTDNGGLFLGGL